MESTTSSPREREQRFRELYDAAYVDLLRFVRRRVHPTHAEDVVGDVMLVAWRRFDDVPVDMSAARAWLFGAARKTLQNTRRREDRHDAVAVRLAEVRHGSADSGLHPDLVACRVDVAAAWPLLNATAQEAIALSVLDGLSAPEAAAVLGISSTAFRLRLSRARRTLRRHVDSATADDLLPGHPASEESPMTKHTADTVITAALRHLDPAPRTDLTEGERERADAAFVRIVATPTDEPVPVERSRSHRRRRQLLVTVGLAGVAGVAIPALLFGGGEAYRSWTPTPEPLSDLAATGAASTCRATLGAPDNEGRVAIAERRGEWTYVLLTGPAIEAVCLMPDDSVGQTISDGEAFFGSYTPDPAAPPTLASDRIEETESQDGSTDEGWFTRTEGYVGSDVTGVTVHTSSGLDIEASVAGNRFAAWWPSTEQSSDHPAETWSYTVHLADGSTRGTTG